MNSACSFFSAAAPACVPLILAIDTSLARLELREMARMCIFGDAVVTMQLIRGRCRRSRYCFGLGLRAALADHQAPRASRPCDRPLRPKQTAGLSCLLDWEARQISTDVKPHGNDFRGSNLTGVDLEAWMHDVDESLQ